MNFFNNNNKPTSYLRQGQRKLLSQVSNFTFNKNQMKNNSLPDETFCSWSFEFNHVSDDVVKEDKSILILENAKSTSITLLFSLGYCKSRNGFHLQGFELTSLTLSLS